jgi:hypothetical protein
LGRAEYLETISECNVDMDIREIICGHRWLMVLGLLGLIIFCCSNVSVLILQLWSLGGARVDDILHKYFGLLCKCLISRRIVSLFLVQNDFKKQLCTRAVQKVSVHFEYLKNLSRGLDVT